MHHAKAVAVVLFFVEYTNQVDDRIHTLNVFFQLGTIKYVCFDKFQIGQHQQITVIVAVPGQNPYTLTTVGEATGYVSTYKTRAAKDANRIVNHVKERI